MLYKGYNICLTKVLVYIVCVGCVHGECEMR